MMAQERAKIAIVGAGKAADSFVNWYGENDFEVFTSEGKGTFCSKPVCPVSELVIGHYDKIVIASQYVNEIAQSLIQAGHDSSDIYWFDFLLNKLAGLDELAFDYQITDSTLYAVYDLEAFPPNYEIAVFLARAELERLKGGLDTISLVIKAGSFGGVSARGSLSHGAENADWRVQHILLPVGQLLPSCKEVLHVRSTSAVIEATTNKQTFPADVASRPDPQYFALGPLAKGAQQGYEVRPFVSSSVARQYISEFLESANIRSAFIAISLREYEYQNSRNSCLALYRDIAKVSVDKGLPVVVVRDTNKAMSAPLEWPGVVECPVASFDLAIRMALYEMALLNVSVSSGPSCGLMLLSRQVDFMMTHIVNNDQRNSSEAFLQSTQGLELGDQYPFSSEFQKICWQQENDKILAEYCDMLNKKIEESNE